MPTTRRQAPRQRRTHTTSSKHSSLPKLTITSPSAHASRVTKSSTKMVSTRSSTRRGAAAAAAPAPALSTSASPSSSTRAPTFPELVRARVAYSPAPSNASASSSASVASPATVTAGPSHQRGQHWIQWPSQLASATTSRASSHMPSSSSRATPDDHSDLGHYAALLQGALLRKGRETTGSPA